MLSQNFSKAQRNFYLLGVLLSCNCCNLFFLWASYKNWTESASGPVLFTSSKMVYNITESTWSQSNSHCVNNTFTIKQVCAKDVWLEFFWMSAVLSRERPGRCLNLQRLPAHSKIRDHLRTFFRRPWRDVACSVCVFVNYPELPQWTFVLGQI